MTHHNFWRGDLIRLRAVEQKDLDDVMQSVDEPDTEAERLEADISFPVSREHDREGLAQLGKERKDDTFFFMVERLDGTLVGYMNTFDVNRRVGSFKYAILIKRPYWGLGYGREAITILLRYYFRELRYQKCTILVYSFNERSLRFHEKLGFTYEGRLRRVVFTNGRHYDEIYFGMTAEEFDSIDPKEELPELHASAELALPQAS